jgi:hypothetical protein
MDPNYLSHKEAWSFEDDMYMSYTKKVLDENPWPQDAPFPVLPEMEKKNV